MPAWETPESEWEDADSIVAAILRWADDGGQMLDLRNIPEQFDNDGS